jgi:hypothetical protein
MYSRVDGAIMSIKPKLETLVEATMTFWRGCCNDEQKSGHINFDEIMEALWHTAGIFQQRLNLNRSMEKNRIRKDFETDSRTGLI